MASSPIICMVWEGTDVIIQVRKMMGSTRPLQADLGTIRGDFGIDTGMNIIHGSDGPESAIREINLWFDPEEIFDWKKTCDAWVYE